MTLFGQFDGTKETLHCDSLCTRCQVIGDRLYPVAIYPVVSFSGEGI